MTDDELKQLIASLGVAQKETDLQLKETDRKLNKVAKMLGGISANQGDIAEDFFYNSFIKEWESNNVCILTCLFVRLLRCGNSYVASYAPVTAP